MPLTVSDRLTKFHIFINYTIFIAFLFLAIGIYVTGTNESLFLAINSMHGILPVTVWKFINFISYKKFMILPILLLIITSIWRREKILNIVLLLVVSYVLVLVLKNMISEPRPYILLDSNSFYFLNMFENKSRSAYMSYPSGHVANMSIFAFAISGMFFQNRPFLQLLMLLLVILTGIARIATGWHWPLDVLTSGLICYVLVRLCLHVRLPSYTRK